MEIKKEPMKIINCLKGAWTCLSGKREPQIIVWFPLLIKFPTTDQQLNDVDNKLYGEFFLIWWTLDPPKFQKRVRSFSFRELNKTDKYGSTNSESEISLKELRKTLAFALHKKTKDNTKQEVVENGLAERTSPNNWWGNNERRRRSPLFVYLSIQLVQHILWHLSFGTIELDDKYEFFCVCIFIGPESNHWLCLSLTDSLTP